MGAELFHSDRRTEMINLIVAFGNFAKSAEKSRYVNFPTVHALVRPLMA